MSASQGFHIYLHPEGDNGSYRYRNGPGEVQRPHLVDRGDCLVVLGDLLEVVHGSLSQGGDPATILIVEFQFVPSKNSRRFKGASITMRFESEDPSNCDLEIVDIAPRGRFAIKPTTKQIEITRSANASLQGGAAGLEAVVGFGCELKESQEKTDQTTVTGTIRLEGLNYGGKNTARWTLSENRAQKDGIPTFLRNVVLLKRREKNQIKNIRFQAVIEIKCSVDLLTSVEEGIDKLRGHVPVDDPVIFDPQERPTTDKFEQQNLRDIDLKGLNVIITNRSVDQAKESQIRLVH